MNKFSHLYPAAHVIEICGGDSATARICKLTRSVVNRWKKPKGQGGTGGMVPAKHQPALLATVEDLSPGDFFVTGPQGLMEEDTASRVVS